MRRASQQRGLSEELRGGALQLHRAVLAELPELLQGSQQPLKGLSVKGEGPCKLRSHLQVNT